MEYVTFVIAITGFIISIYTFVTTKLGRIPRLEVFRFTPDRLVVDDDFDILHVFTDANFIVTNLSDKPNTVIRMDASVNFGNKWIEGIVTGKRLSESMRTRTDYNSADHTPHHHNEIVKEWVSADVCPIMLSPQASGIPNMGVSLRFDFQNDGAVTDLSKLKLRLTLHDQYGAKHTFDVDTKELTKLGVTRYPRFFEDEVELGKLKDSIPGENTESLLRVVFRKYAQDMSQSTISIRRYYPMLGERKLGNVSHFGRDGYAYNSYRPRDFKKHLQNGEEGLRVLGEIDGFTFSFEVEGDSPKNLIVQLPDSWVGDSLEVPIPEDFAELSTTS